MEEAQSQFSKLVARAWSDEEFHKKLLSNPRSVLPEFGIHIPDSVEVRIVENSDKVVYFALPPKPSEELSDEQLELVSGGDTSVQACCCCCPCCSC